MRQLNPEERRRWQSTTLATPRRRYGADARLLFKLEDLVFGPARTLPKFRARELIARTPYQSWEQAAYLKADQWGNGRSRAEKLFRTVNEDHAEQDNEHWSPSIRSGRPLHSVRRSRPATGPTIRWPTCSARSAATKASTRKLASPA